ncbi:MAG TPA: universal stress protein [Thermoanaerobaculia bacterium]|jgi:nucleotide-binding universal stress UspA family protein|nr:universal stress protein [Thermoanaerobaculia bacterium]
MIERIVVPVDFSESSCRAARYAVEELAPPLGAEVVFVTVLEASDLRVAMSAGLHGFETDADVRRQVAEWIEQQFRRIEAAGNGVKARRDIRRGLPEREIIEAIREHRASIVVMGVHGIGGRDPIGSKAEYVLEHGGVPLLLVREDR